MKCIYCQIKCICIETLKEFQKFKKQERYSIFDGGHGLKFTYEQLKEQNFGNEEIKKKKKKIIYLILTLTLYFKR